MGDRKFARMVVSAKHAKSVLGRRCVHTVANAINAKTVEEAQFVHIGVKSQCVKIVADLRFAPITAFKRIAKTVAGPRYVFMVGCATGVRSAEASKFVLTSTAETIAETVLPRICRKDICCE